MDRVVVLLMWCVEVLFLCCVVAFFRKVNVMVCVRCWFGVLLLSCSCVGVALLCVWFVVVSLLSLLVVVL